MIKFKQIVPVVITLFALSACEDIPTGSTASPSRTTTVDMERGQWSMLSGSWNRKSNNYELRFTVRNIGGKAALCGVQFDGTKSMRNIQTRLLRDLGMFVDDKLVVQGFDHFTKVDDVRARDLRGNCKVGSLDWNSSYGDNDNWDVRRRGDGRYRL